MQDQEGDADEPDEMKKDEGPRGKGQCPRTDSWSEGKRREEDEHRSQDEGGQDRPAS